MVLEHPPRQDRDLSYMLKAIKEGLIRNCSRGMLDLLIQVITAYSQRGNIKPTDQQILEETVTIIKAFQEIGDFRSPKVVPYKPPEKEPKMAKLASASGGIHLEIMPQQPDKVLTWTAPDGSTPTAMLIHPAIINIVGSPANLVIYELRLREVELTCQFHYNHADTSFVFDYIHLADEGIRQQSKIYPFLLSEGKPVTGREYLEEYYLPLLRLTPAT